MHARHLRKHILAHNRFIGGNHDARIRLHHAAHIIQAVLVYVGNSTEMVFQDSLHAGKRCVARTFAQAVDGGVQTLAATQYGCQHVTHREVVIIVGMEVEMLIRITLHHLPHELNDLQRVQHAQCVGQHIALYVGPDQRIHQLEDIFGRILHAVAPVFQVNIHFHILHICIVHYRQDIFDMLLRRFLQLAGAMLQRPLAQQVDDAAAGGMYPVYRGMSIHETEHLYFRQHITSCRPVAYHLHRIKFPFGHPRGSHLHPVHLQIFKQQTGYHQFFMGHKRHSAGLFTVAESGVHDFYLRMIMLHCSSPKLLFYPCFRQENQCRPNHSSGNASCRH